MYSLLSNLSSFRRCVSPRLFRAPTIMLLLLLLFGFPHILYHCIFSLTVLCLFVIYKIYHNSKLQAQQLTTSGLTEKSSIIMASRKFDSPNFAYHATIALILITLPSILCAEQDANILKPFASIAKSVISAVTTGVPTEVEFGASHMVRDIVSLSVRTGFPVTIPRGFTNKTQEFFDRVRQRVADADASMVSRNTLANLKVDLDAIVDGIVNEVRDSPDGLYTDYLKTKVNGVPLEEACVKIGIQLKAYGIDLKYYRDIAGAVLGVPVLPTVASGVVGAGKLALAPLSSVSNLPSNLYNTGTRLPGAAIGTVSQLGNSAFQQVDNIRGYIPGVRSLPSPMSLLGLPTQPAPRA